jgi:hypothetical protein
MNAAQCSRSGLHGAAGHDGVATRPNRQRPTPRGACAVLEAPAGRSGGSVAPAAHTVAHARPVAPAGRPPGGGQATGQRYPLIVNQERSPLFPL